MMGIMNKREYRKLVKEVAVRSHLSRKTTYELLSQGYMFTESMDGSINWELKYPNMPTQTLEAFLQSFAEDNNE